MNILELQPFQEIHGNPKGKSLWALVIIDEDDAEDTQCEIWRADHHDQLAELALEHWVSENEDDPMNEAIEQEFKNNWGVTILPTKIGRLDKKKAKKK